jgi:hypothetical protein
MPKGYTTTEACVADPSARTYQLNDERILEIQEYLRTSLTGISRVSVRSSAYRFWNALEILPVHSSQR